MRLPSSFMNPSLNKAFETAFRRRTDQINTVFLEIQRLEDQQAQARQHNQPFQHAKLLDSKKQQLEFWRPRLDFTNKSRDFEKTLHKSMQALKDSGQVPSSFWAAMEAWEVSMGGLSEAAIKEKEDSVKRLTETWGRVDNAQRRRMLAQVVRTRGFSMVLRSYMLVTKWAKWSLRKIS